MRPSERGSTGRRWLRRNGAALLLLTVLSGCRMVGSQASPLPVPSPVPDAPVSMPEGAYVGVIVVEGGEIQSMLRLTREGTRRLQADMALGADLRAEGSGEVDGSNVRLELSYPGSCPGRMVLVGRWDPGVDVLSGVVRASDCTGEAEGTFRFSR